jgi:hypothetical protein
MVTGFNAYRIYLNVKKVHFSLKNKHNIMNGLIKKEKFLNHWNKIRANLDGKLFQALEKQANDSNTLIRIYASYFLHDSNFYIKHIIDDKLKIFKKNENELENLKECVTNDFIKLIKICKDDNIKPKELFRFITLPLIFKYKNEISWNSIIVFDRVFDILNNVNESKLNEIDLNQWHQYKNILINYKSIIESIVSKTNWKEHIKNIL